MSPIYKPEVNTSLYYSCPALKNNWQAYIQQPTKCTNSTCLSSEMTPCYLVSSYVTEEFADSILSSQLGLLRTWRRHNNHVRNAGNYLLLQCLRSARTLLNIEAGNSSECPVTTYKSTCLHTPEDFNLYQNRCDKLKFHLRRIITHLFPLNTHTLNNVSTVEL